MEFAVRNQPEVFDKLKPPHRLQPYSLFHRMNKKFVALAILSIILSGCGKIEEAPTQQKTPEELQESFNSDLSKIVDDSYQKASKESPSN